MSSAVIEETAGTLASASHDTAVRYRRFCTDSSMSDEVMNSFSGICRDIVSAGWKSHESVDAYLDVALLGPDGLELVRVGHLGRQFSGYSFEPSVRYFELVGQAIVSGRESLLPSVEAQGLNLQSRYQHAAGLLAEFFLCAKKRMASLGPDEFNAWLDVLSRSEDLGREEISLLLAGGDPVEGGFWTFISELMQRSVTAAKSCLRESTVLMALSSDNRQRLNDILLGFAAEDLTALIRGIERVRSRVPDEMGLLLDLVLDLPDTETAALLLEHAADLPLSSPHIVRQWLDSGLEEAGANPAALRAWVALESSKSTTLMESLQGQVRFDSHQRTFDLIAEAVSGRRMIVTADEEDGDIRRPEAGLLATCDGRNITLPLAINIFNSEDSNFGFYKVSLFHQLGYVEFGCFAWIEDVVATLSLFDDSRLAERIFVIAEDARIDWQLEHRYPGIVPQLSLQKNKAWSMRAQKPVTRRGQLLEAMVGMSLDVRYETVIPEPCWPDASLLWSELIRLRDKDAEIGLTIEVCRRCYEIVTAEIDGLLAGKMREADLALTLAEMPEPVAYRGEIDVAEVEKTFRIEALVNEIQEEISPDQDSLTMGPGDPDQVDIEELEAGEVSEGAGVMLEELSRELDIDPGQLETASREDVLNFLGGIAGSTREATRHLYDEWDHAIHDYRARWCTLFEHREVEQDEDYFHRVMVEHQDLAHRIRHQLNRVRPEMLRKVRGFAEGEELDLERSVTWFVDRKAGYTPEEKIYIQRQRKERDVATLFLLDMSASTDDIIPDSDNEPVMDQDAEDDEYLMEYFRQRKIYEDAARRIIDLEKESVILMSEALEKLGDAYSVCGFSGYGRDQVDYYLCKDFDEPLDARARGRIGGIRPCRSTRMGAPIRHGIQQLLETESRIKAMIIISDGYPQDHDYGSDRNSKEYGLMDTMKALSEARQRGILTHCLTVDPSGHDYLREMCPDSQYMVIQDIEQLPEELSRVYRSLTG